MSDTKIAKCLRDVKLKYLIGYFYVQLFVIPTIWIIYAFNAKYSFIPVTEWIVLLIAIILTYVSTRLLVMGSILMYKAYAPMSTRDRCRFYPTCSTYTFIAIKKYGLIWGGIKGFRRILRCKPPNGGEDWP